MTAYAPACRILTVNGAALSTTSVTVEPGLGEIFPAVPFDVLIWPVQQFPVAGTNAHQATNAEECTVTARDNDTMTLVRSDVPIALSGGLMIACTSVMPIFDLGDDVPLVATIPGNDDPFTFHLHDPDGYLTARSVGDTAEFQGTAGADLLTRSGLYHYAFSDALGRRSGEASLFIRFSDVG